MDKKHEVEKLKGRIYDLKKWLPYADHGAYGQDSRKIYDMEQRIKELKCSNSQ